MAVPAPALEQWIARVEAQRAEVDKALGAPLPARPPTFCTGCPERPVFSAMKLLRKEMGPVHVSADIGCHSFATFAPFSQGNSILGYGMSLASAAAVSGTQTNRPISVMGDGGFWHNGLITGVAGAVFNKDDSVLIVMNNGYSSATGQQDILSSTEETDGRGKGLDIEAALKSMGVPWIKRVRTYGVTGVANTLREALRTGAKGLKVIIADGECQLARQRRIRPEIARQVAAGERVVRTRFWIDPEVCTGDHSCIRLSGCPSLTLKPNEDPLRTDPIAHVNNDCVGCGLCGEVAHAAQLCPSFAQIDIIQNPSRWDRLKRRASAALMRLFGSGRDVGARARAGGVSPWPPRSPSRVLIAALGGEGGGVLASWLHRSAIAAGHFVQGTSIPGVAQRTGATTYYLEIVPGAAARHGASGARPVLALNAAPGEVDLVVASELLEATRTIAAGFVTPERTMLVASSARVFTIDEKAAMGDGRLDEQRMADLARRFSRRAVIADFAAIAAEAKAPLNAVLLGAVAASGALPIAEEIFRAAIRAEGKAVDANLRGFDAGMGERRRRPLASTATDWRDGNRCSDVGPDPPSPHESGSTRSPRRHRRRPQAPHRLPGRPLRPALSGARASLRRPPRRRRRLHPRARPPSRRAHERGGRDPRGATQAARGPSGARRAGGQGARGRHRRRHGIPQTRPRGDLRPAAARARTLGAASRAARSRLAAQGHDHAPVGLLAAEGCWRRSSAGGRARCALPRRRRGWSAG